MVAVEVFPAADEAEAPDRDYNNHLFNITNISKYVVKGSYTFHVDDDFDFQPDECGTGVLKEKQIVFEQANTGSKQLGHLQFNNTVKVLRAYVNGNQYPLMHMIEYNGGGAYVEGILEFEGEGVLY